MKNICHQQYSLNRKKRSHDTENHCGYLIILNLAKSPFVNTVSRQNLAETKSLNLKTGFKPKTWLSLRPFVNTGPDSWLPGPVFMKGLSQGLDLKLRLLSQVSAQKLLKLLS